MISGKKIIVVLPAFNAANTLEKTYKEIPKDIVDQVILTDDFSSDKTAEIARKLGVSRILEHRYNQGYGANQKTCYREALNMGADIIVLLHPDYQYTPLLIAPMCHLIADGVYPVVLGSRILGKGALKGGMPLYKYFFNRVLTLIQNILMSQKLSEYHTGLRAFDAAVLKGIDFEKNSDNFVFDNQLLAQILYRGYEIGEISCPTIYSDESSSINFRRSVVYGAGVILTSIKYFISKYLGLKCELFK